MLVSWSELVLFNTELAEIATAAPSASSAYCQALDLLKKRKGLHSRKGLSQDDLDLAKYCSCVWKFYDYVKKYFPECFQSPGLDRVASARKMFESFKQNVKSQSDVMRIAREIFPDVFENNILEE